MSTTMQQVSNQRTSLVGYTVECVGKYHPSNPVTIGKTYVVLSENESYIYIKNNLGEEKGYLKRFFSVI